MDGIDVLNGTEAVAVACRDALEARLAHVLAVHDGIEVTACEHLLTLPPEESAGAYWLRTTVGHLTLVEVPDVGHSVYFEAPAAFNEAVLAFLQRAGVLGSRQTAGASG